MENGFTKKLWKQIGKKLKIEPIRRKTDYSRQQLQKQKRKQLLKLEKQLDVLKSQHRICRKILSIW